MSKFLLATLLTFGLSQWALTETQQVDPTIFTALKSSQRVTLILSMSENERTHQDVLDHVGRASFMTRGERLNSITAALKEYSAESQKGVLTFLNHFKDDEDDPSTKLEVVTLWISNQIIVRGANETLVRSLVGRHDLAKVELDKEFFLPQPIDPSEPFSIDEVNVGNSSVQWGVETVKAPQVWESGNRGQGIVVGVIDTGVRATHVALKDSWRESFGWYDPEKKAKTPYDAHGHGSHTTGSIAGTVNGIGVAPSAKWIHCRGCGEKSCPQSTLLECGQWMSCPMDASSGTEDCTKAPHIVSNSWGGFGGSDSYEKVIATWRTKGIIPVFAAGNNGPFCLTIGSPADSPSVIAVGSTAKGDQMSRFSSSGPGYKRFLIKPDVSAPGSDIISVAKSSDTEYVKMSGTSMACPHAAGVIALMMSKNKAMSYDEVKESLTKSCDPVKPAVVYFFCGGSSRGKKFPNNNAGFGRINAQVAVG